MVVMVALSGCLFEDERRIIEDEEDELIVDDPFYTLPADLPAGDPVEVIRSIQIGSAPVGTLAWRLIYHTRDLAGEDVAASAVLIVPELPAPSGGRTVVSWGHPTTGAVTRCGPSLAFDPFLGIEGMDALLELGYAVVATDYPGLSLVGPSSYLIGDTEGNSMLDAARAAQQIGGADAEIARAPLGSLAGRSRRPLRGAARRGLRTGPRHPRGRRGGTRRRPHGAAQRRHR